MILIYVDNKNLDKVADFVDSLGDKRFSYRNPRYFKKPENVDGVYIQGDWPDVEAAYDNIIGVSGADYPTSTDYTVREARELAYDMTDEQLKRFIQGDDRKTIQKLI